jgi:hypothetical protein
MVFLLSTGHIDREGLSAFASTYLFPGRLINLSMPTGMSPGLSGRNVLLDHGLSYTDR